ncbi:energy transducer TonB [uncultured Hymenobacter sp.]|uniref:energy transducer TonB n=1 Tax=uncultured Hymenobacter sp. TaxID=170016 RepID=UPI0035CA9C24
MKNTNYFYALLFILFIPIQVFAQQNRTTQWESGVMDKKEKVGVWEYYGYTASKRQVTVQRYDHTEKKLLFYRPVEQMNYNAEMTAGNWARRLVDQPPLYIGGDAALAAYTSKVVYPQQAQDQQLQGKVIVGMIIDTLGHASGHHLVQRLGGGCDEEALRISQKIPDQWVPARVGTRAVPVEFELPFTFKLLTR